MKYIKFSVNKLMEVIQTLMLKSVILKTILYQKYDEYNIALKTIPSDNVNKEQI